MFTRTVASCELLLRKRFQFLVNYPDHVFVFTNWKWNMSGFLVLLVFLRLWCWQYISDETICLFRKDWFFAFTVNKYKSAWNVISGFPYVSVRIKSLPSYSIVGSNGCVIRCVLNPRDSVLRLFQIFSAVQTTIAFQIVQRREWVVKTGRRVARTPSFHSWKWSSESQRSNNNFERGNPKN